MTRESILPARLKSLSEPWADTASPAGCTVLTVFAGIAVVFWSCAAGFLSGVPSGRANEWLLYGQIPFFNVGGFAPISEGRI
jgi:hypothetical protein